MDGAHDMGGVRGFGPVVPEPNEPVFHEAWERRAFALTVAMSRPGGWNIDMSRFARENRPPDDYLSKSYFQIWLAGLDTYKNGVAALLRRDGLTARVAKDKALLVTALMEGGLLLSQAQSDAMAFKLALKQAVAICTVSPHD